MYLRILYILVCLTVPAHTWAQVTDCKDENAANPTFQCTEPFSPVCACDGKTYFSRCDAMFHYGINQFSQFNSGVCGDWEMFIATDAPNRSLTIFFQFRESGGNATFMIVDMFGNVVQQQFIRSQNNMAIQLDISTVAYTPGIYMAYAFGGSNRKIIKFAAGSM